MNRVRRFLIRARSILWTALALSIISLAMLVGIANLLLPYANQWRPDLEVWLTQRIGREVSIEHLDARWASFGPQIEMRGLAIGAADDEDRFRVAMADIRVDLMAWIKYHSHGLGAFRLLIPELSIGRDSLGRWQVAGMGSGNDAGEGEVSGAPWALLDLQSMIGIHIERIRIYDSATEINLEIPGGEIRFHNQGSFHRTAARLGSSDTGFVELTAELHADQQRMDFFARTDGLEMAALDPAARNVVDISDGDLTFDVWGQFGPEQKRIEGSLALRALDLAARPDNPVQGLYHLSSLRTDFRLDATAFDQWEARLANLQVQRGDGQGWESASLGLARDQTDWSVWWDRLNVEDVLDALILTPVMSAPVRRRLAALNPRGALVEVALSGKRTDTAMHGEVRIEDANWLPSNAVPGVSNVSADLKIEGHQARGRLAIRDGTIDLGEHLPAPLTGALLSGEIALDWMGIPQLTMDSLHYQRGEVSLRGRARVIANGNRPFVDLGVQVDTVPISAASDYWIISRMPPRVVQWLNTDVSSGQVDEGSLVLFGDLDHWPFANGEGTFAAQASVSDVHLVYHPLWPEARNLSANLLFHASGMDAHVSRATIQGVTVKDAELRLPRFKNPVIALELEARGAAGRVIELMRASPLKARLEAYASGVRVEGRAELSLAMNIPLKPELGKTNVSGEIRLAGARVLDEAWDITFDDVHGTTRFSDDGFDTGELRTSFRGVPATLTVRAGGPARAHDAIVEGILKGRSHPRALSVFAEASALDSFIEGEMDWTARLAVPTNDPSRPHFTLDGELNDLEITLPAPLTKPAGQPMHLELDLDMAPYRNHFRASVGSGFHVAAERTAGDAPWRIGVALGETLPNAPDQPGLSIQGHADRINVDGWLAMLRGSSSLDTGSGPAPRVNVRVDDLVLAGRHFPGLVVNAGGRGDHFVIDVEGEQIAGHLRLPSTLGEQRLLVAEFDRLYWPEPAGDTPEANIDPAAYPPMDFYAGKLVFGEVDLGQVRFSSVPANDGMRIEEFTTQSEDLRLNVSGHWRSAGESQFEVTATSPDLGATLDRFGFSEVIDGGQLLARLDARWPGAPSDFELAALDGELELQVTRGQIVEVQPGAGRIFGLLSVSALPRRLALDFSDLFKSGLTFDHISGAFALTDGDAHTDNLIIESPTADVRIVGRTDLAAREYEQTITVVPKVGETLPLVGAIAGGGVGAAALFVLQGVFRSQIDRMTQYHYTVRGPWADPQVELLGADQLPIEPPETAAVP